MNNNISVRNNQAFPKYYNITINWMFGITPELKDPEHLLVKHKFTKNSRKILITLLKYMGVNQQTYISQELIARKSGVHHDTVYRTLKLFAELGIIKKKYRGANKTCIYSFGKFLHDPLVKYALRDLIPNLYWAIESAARICKNLLGALISPIAAIFKHDTARLSNDKNKELKYIYTRERGEQKPKEFVPTQDDIQRYREYEKDLKKKKDDYAAELAKLLGLQT